MLKNCQSEFLHLGAPLHKKPVRIFSVEAYKDHR